MNRKTLDSIILKNDSLDWWQPERFEKYTKHLLPPELEILENPPPETENYNCFIFALRLHDNKEIITETKGFIYDSFIKKLIEIGELTKTTNPQTGDYVVYQDKTNYPDNLTHIGIIDKDKIVSKWAWGPLIKHGVWDVPQEYGDDVFYFKAISSEKAEELYKTYKQFNLK